MEQQTRFRLWLQNEFNNRCKKNPRYSLRSFSKFLSLDPSSVSQILSGNRKPSRKFIERVVDHIDPQPTIRAEILDHQLGAPAEEDYRQLTIDSFAVVSEWYHYAILELTFVEGFRSEPAWIARKLGITVTEARSAIERLIRLELLEDKDGRLVKTDGFITNYREGVTAPALRDFQKQILAKALDAIENTPAVEKDITSMTMAINPEKLSEAKVLIKNFRRSLSGFLQEGKPTRVYHLGVQLYPVSKKEETI